MKRLLLALSLLAFATCLFAQESFRLPGTAYEMEYPTTPPTAANNVLTCPVPTPNNIVSQCYWGPSSGLAGSGTLTGNGSATAITIYPTTSNSLPHTQPTCWQAGVVLPASAFTFAPGSGTANDTVALNSAPGSSVVTVCQEGVGGAGSGATYTGTSPIVVSESTISAPTAALLDQVATVDITQSPYYASPSGATITTTAGTTPTTTLTLTGTSTDVINYICAGRN